MRTMIIVLAAAAIHMVARAESTFITIKTCSGGRAMIRCRGTSMNDLSNIQFWAKYPNYNYNMQADIDSEWMCKISSYGQNVTPLEFKIPASGLTILVRDGMIFKTIQKAEQNCPIDSF